MSARRIRTYMGDARGHWDGNTLVVETTNFKDQTAYRGANGATLRLIERFTPIGPHTVEWSVTVDDPATWTRPWTFAMNLTKKDPASSRSNTPATKATTACEISSAARARTNGRGRPHHRAPTASRRSRLPLPFAL